MSEAAISLLERVGVPAFIVIALMIGIWRAAHSVAPTLKGWIDMILNRWAESSRGRDAMDQRIIDHQHKIEVDSQRRHTELLERASERHTEMLDRTAESAKEARHATKNVPQQTHGLLAPEFDRVIAEIKHQGQRTRAAMRGADEDTGDIKDG